MATLKIRKTRIVKRDTIYQLDAALIDKTKAIKNLKLRKQAFDLHGEYLVERQSMKKAHARNKWKAFVTKHS